MTELVDNFIRTVCEENSMSKAKVYKVESFAFDHCFEIVSEEGKRVTRVIIEEYE